MKRCLSLLVLGLSLQVLGVSLGVSPAAADRIHLLDGAVLDGNAQRVGHKIVIELTEGKLTVDAAMVVRIEPGKSQRDELEERLAKLDKRDVHGRLQLANYCRDHQLIGRERELLRGILEVDPNHAEARARLGYVKSDVGWITTAEQRAREGRVLYLGQWVTPAERLELERIAAATKAAQFANDKAALEVQSKRLELEAQKAELARAEQEARERERERDEGPLYVAPWGYGYGYGAAYSGRHDNRHGKQPSHHRRDTPPNYSQPGNPPFIPGAPDPRSSTWTVPGMRDPRSYF